MVVTAKDLRFNTSILFDLLSKGEEITVTYRGKAKAKLIPINEEKREKTDRAFGMWQDKTESVDEAVRQMRKGRTFDL